MAIGAEAQDADHSGGGQDSAANPAAAVRSAQWGGARADFVASLGRKVSDVRALLRATAPDDEAPGGRRDELRRRVHALHAMARMLRFDAMVRSIDRARTLLDANPGAALDAGDVAALEVVLDSLSTLTGDEADERASGEVACALVDAAPAASALIVGGEALAEALTLTETREASVFDCERTGHAAGGLGLARALAPDLVIVDGDLGGALDLVESLLDDPLTEAVPILVVGDFRTPELASRFVALGVSKTLPKPISPSALQRACHDVVDHRAGRTTRVVLGEPTVEQLGERLAEEVRRALVDAVDGNSRRTRVALGEGSEVLGALWGAIARVREIVTLRSDGAVRYKGDGPDGAVALAPGLHPEVAASDRVQRRVRGAAADVSLDGRIVVVADDDPGVTWFIADLLRGAGCVVHEALDGAAAFKLAQERSPDVIVSDILMPGLDGFALCRAIKRDVALRDVPVALLSWKEDLLQRTRELGAGAAAYLRKESDASAILARVREVLWPKARIEARLRVAGEVRGRLDDLSVHSLLDLACRVRTDCRVTVRDASFLYEVEIRSGTLRKATRSARDGSYCRGERVVASMLGVGSGRFTVTPTTAPVAGDLEGTLREQLARPVRLAREATAVLTGHRLAQVERVLLDPETFGGYLLATPRPASDVVRELADGASPRALIRDGAVAPALLEGVLADLAVRGGILGVVGAEGEDLLDPTVDRGLDPARQRLGRVGPLTPTPIAKTVTVEPLVVRALEARPSLEDVLVDAMRDRPLDVPPASPSSLDAPESASAPHRLRVAREVARHPQEAPLPAAGGVELSLSLPIAVSVPQAIEAPAELSRTAPSRERTRRAAEAAARDAEASGLGLVRLPRAGRGLLAGLLALAVATAMGAYACAQRPTPAEPESTTKTP